MHTELHPEDDQRERGRRLLNVLVAAVALILAAPLMALIALVIKLTSPGPVLFTQPRVGLNRRWMRNGGPSGRRRRDAGGRQFTIYKFRTMHDNGSGPVPEVWASAGDPRITPVGRVLRKLRLDELPQLVNVLRGDMNIVGPRPEQPGIFDRLRRQVDNYELRQLVRPGITGLAQVNQRYDQTIEDVRKKVALDLEYIHGRSAIADLKIMVRTLPVMLLQRGAH